MKLRQAGVDALFGLLMTSDLAVFQTILHRLGLLCNPVQYDVQIWAQVSSGDQSLGRHLDIDRHVW